MGPFFWAPFFGPFPLGPSLWAHCPWPGRSWPRPQHSPPPPPPPPCFICDLQHSLLREHSLLRGGAPPPHIFYRPLASMENRSMENPWKINKNENEKKCRKMTIVGGCTDSRIPFVFVSFSAKIICFIRKDEGPIWRPKDHLVMKGLFTNIKNLDFKETHYY